MRVGKTLSYKYRIIAEKGKMGIKNIEDNSFLLPMKYDNVFFNEPDVFVLHRNGKIGAVRTESDKIYFIAECEYDILDIFNHDLILKNNQKIRYYNSVTKSVRDFIEIIVDYPCLHCKDEKFQYILYGEQAEEIYKKEYTSYSESCFCFCGYTDKGPVFYDARYSTYLYPNQNEYKMYKEIFNHPVIVNRQNVCNITEGENGLGVIDSYGNIIMENKYDSVRVELKITAIKENETEQKIIPCQKETFERG